MSSVMRYCNSLVIVCLSISGNSSQQRSRHLIPLLPLMMITFPQLSGSSVERSYVEATNLSRSIYRPLLTVHPTIAMPPRIPTRALASLPYANAPIASSSTLPPPRSSPQCQTRSLHHSARSRRSSSFSAPHLATEQRVSLRCR